MEQRKFGSHVKETGVDRSETKRISKFIKKLKLSNVKWGKSGIFRKNGKKIYLLRCFGEV